MKTKIITVLLCALSLTLLAADIARGEDRDRYRDFGIGGGINFDGNPVSQVLLVPAYTKRLSGTRLLWYRIEGNIEILEGFRKITLVAGVSPFLRWYMNEKAARPYLEIGGGLNFITRNHTANKESGGFVVFSPSAGAGIQFASQGRPISISCRLRHLSNAHIFPINQSMNMLYFLFSVGI